MKMPKGFTAHTDGKMPVDPEQRVETIILTEQGHGSGGILPAKLHDWSLTGVGAVVGYRLAERGEQPHIDRFQRRKDAHRLKVDK